ASARHGRTSKRRDRIVCITHRSISTRRRILMSCSVRSVLVGIVCIVSSWASVAGAVSVSGITYLPTDDGEVFQVPSNVLDVASLRNTPSGMSTAAGARGNLSARDLAQTFTVSSTDFPTGVDVAG